MVESAGDLIRRRREQAGLTQMELAPQLGTSSQLSRWENDLAPPPADKWDLIQKVLTIGDQEWLSALKETGKRMARAGRGRRRT